MYLSRIRLTGTASNEYAVHQAVWKAFSDQPERRREFLYRLEEATRPRAVYALSHRPPVNNKGSTTETRRFEPVLRPGETVLFRLRANPVVARSTGQGNRGKRHDVVRDLKKQVGSSAALPLVSLIHRAGLDWLRKRAAKSGFTFEDQDVQVNDYHRHTLVKPGAKSPIRFSSIDFSGRLVVEGPRDFLNALTSGHGPAKGFGMGLMLIRRDATPK